jgi:GNAT superfamily N-acetyltransferase
MNIDISKEPMTSVVDYARVPIAFEVRSIIEVKIDEAGSFNLLERCLDTSYIKDYDAIKGEGPMNWGKNFDLSNWGLFVARTEGLVVGGVTIAFQTASVAMLEGRDDLAVLWDIRVTPAARGQGVGRSLLQAAEKWAAARSCNQIKAETQNINVPACQFYKSQGFEIEKVNRSAYSSFPDEIQIIWGKKLPQF